MKLGNIRRGGLIVIFVITLVTLCGILLDLNAGVPIWDGWVMLCIIAAGVAAIIYNLGDWQNKY